MTPQGYTHIRGGGVLQYRKFCLRVLEPDNVFFEYPVHRKDNSLSDLNLQHYDKFNTAERTALRKELKELKRDKLKETFLIAYQDCLDLDNADPTLSRFKKQLREFGVDLSDNSIRTKMLDFGFEQITSAASASGRKGYTWHYEKKEDNNT